MVTNGGCGNNCIGEFNFMLLTHIYGAGYHIVIQWKYVRLVKKADSTAPICGGA
jgi:hypothetical protein